MHFRIKETEDGYFRVKVRRYFWYRDIEDYPPDVPKFRSIRAAKEFCDKYTEKVKRHQGRKTRGIKYQT